MAYPNLHQTRKGNLGMREKQGEGTFEVLGSKPGSIVSKSQAVRDAIRASAKAAIAPSSSPLYVLDNNAQHTSNNTHQQQPMSRSSSAPRQLGNPPPAAVVSPQINVGGSSQINYNSHQASTSHRECGWLSNGSPQISDPAHQSSSSNGNVMSPRGPLRQPVHAGSAPACGAQLSVLSMAPNGVNARLLASEHDLLLMPRRPKSAQDSWQELPSASRVTKATWEDRQSGTKAPAGGGASHWGSGVTRAGLTGQAAWATPDSSAADMPGSAAPAAQGPSNTPAAGNLGPQGHVGLYGYERGPRLGGGPLHPTQVHVGMLREWGGLGGILDRPTSAPLSSGAQPSSSKVYSTSRKEWVQQQLLLLEKRTRQGRQRRLQGELGWGAQQQQQQQQGLQHQQQGQQGQQGQQEVVQLVPQQQHSNSASSWVGARAMLDAGQEELGHYHTPTPPASSSNAVLGVAGALASQPHFTSPLRRANSVPHERVLARASPKNSTANATSTANTTAQVQMSNHAILIGNPTDRDTAGCSHMSSRPIGSIFSTSGWNNPPQQQHSFPQQQLLPHQQQHFPPQPLHSHPQKQLQQQPTPQQVHAQQQLHCLQQQQQQQQPPAQKWGIRGMLKSRSASTLSYSGTSSNTTPTTTTPGVAPAPAPAPALGIASYPYLSPSHSPRGTNSRVVAGLHPATPVPLETGPSRGTMLKSAQPLSHIPSKPTPPSPSFVMSGAPGSTRAPLSGDGVVVGVGQRLGYNLLLQKHPQPGPAGFIAGMKRALSIGGADELGSHACGSHGNAQVTQRAAGASNVEPPTIVVPVQGVQLSASDLKAVEEKGGALQQHGIIFAPHAPNAPQGAQQLNEPQDSFDAAPLVARARPAHTRKAVDHAEGIKGSPLNGAATNSGASSASSTHTLVSTNAETCAGSSLPPQAASNPTQHQPLQLHRQADANPTAPSPSPPTSLQPSTSAPLPLTASAPPSTDTVPASSPVYPRESRPAANSAVHASDCGPNALQPIASPAMQATHIPLTQTDAATHLPHTHLAQQVTRPKNNLAELPHSQPTSTFSAQPKPSPAAPAASLSAPSAPSAPISNPAHPSTSAFNTSKLPDLSPTTTQNATTITLMRPVPPTFIPAPPLLWSTDRAPPALHSASNSDSASPLHFTHATDSAAADEPPAAATHCHVLQAAETSAASRHSCMPYQPPGAQAPQAVTALGSSNNISEQQQRRQAVTAAQAASKGPAPPSVATVAAAAAVEPRAAQTAPATFKEVQPAPPAPVPPPTAPHGASFTHAANVPSSPAATATAVRVVGRLPDAVAPDAPSGPTCSTDRGAPTTSVEARLPDAVASGTPSDPACSTAPAASFEACRPSAAASAAAAAAAESTQPQSGGEATAPAAPVTEASSQWSCASEVPETAPAASAATASSTQSRSGCRRSRMSNNGSTTSVVAAAADGAEGSARAEGSQRGGVANGTDASNRVGVAKGANSSHAASSNAKASGGNAGCNTSNKSTKDNSSTTTNSSSSGSPRTARSRTSKSALTLDLSNIGGQFPQAACTTTALTAVPITKCAYTASSSESKTANSSAAANPSNSCNTNLGIAGGSIGGRTSGGAFVNGLRRSRLGSPGHDSKTDGSSNGSPLRKGRVSPRSSNTNASKDAAKKHLGKHQRQQQQQQRLWVDGDPKAGMVHSSCAPMAELLAHVEDFANALGLNAEWVAELSSLSLSFRMSQST